MTAMKVVRNYELSIIKFPSGRYGYVGSVPEILCKEVKTNFGIIWQSHAFDSLGEAKQFAQINGFNPAIHAK